MMNKIQLTISAIIFLMLFNACSDKHIFQVVPYEQDAQNKGTIDKIDFFLETSVSMKGYVNPSTVGDYPLKDIVPYLITDLDNQYGAITSLHTITDKPKKYTGSRDQFYNQLRRGTLLGGRSSKLQHVFGSIIDSIRPNSVSILVSDCILDLGREDVLTQGSLVTTKIYKHLTQKKDIGVAVFKYLSDFNGTYYYDRKNTGSNNQSRRPFYNTILKKRPFYIWVLGDKEAVKTLLSEPILERYDKAYSYNIAMDQVPYTLLKEPKSGKIVVNSEKQTLMIKEVTEKFPAQFTIGVNLENGTSLFEPLFMEPSNYEITPAYLNEYLIVLPKNKQSESMGTLLDSDYTHFLKSSLRYLDADTKEITIRINNSPAIWYDATNLSDDLGVPAVDLEQKTFAFKCISNAFERAFKTHEPLLEFKLVKQQ